MKALNYSSKGIKVKKLRNYNLIPQKSMSNDIKKLLKTNYFKPLKIFEDVLLDDKLSKKFIKQYMRESSEKNDFDIILNSDKENDKKICAIIPSDFKNKILTQYNPNKE